MSEKKNIDRLFREKFKDFDVAPPEQLWQNIEAGLKKDKKKRKVIPIWFRLSGVAAVLLLGLMLSLPFFRGIDTGNTPVVIENTDAKQGPEKKITPVAKPLRPSQTVTELGNETIVTNPDEAVASGNSNNTGAENGQRVTTGNSSNNTGSTTTNRSGAGKTKVAGSNPYNNNAVAYENRDAKSSAKNKKVNRPSGGIIRSQESQTGIAHHDKKNNIHSGNGNKNKAIAEDGRNNANNSSNTNGQPTPDAVAENNRPNLVGTKGSNTNNAAVSNKVAAEDNRGVADNTVNAQGSVTAGNAPEGKIINRGIVPETTVAEVAVDTVKPVNELEKILQDKLNGEKDKEEKALADTDKNKWNIKPQLAPVFYSSMSEGSPIDPQFAGNSKDYNNDLSYGVGINYALSKRVSLRTGVNTVNLSYTTNGVQFYAALNQQTPNTTARGTVANIVVQNGSAGTSQGFTDTDLSIQKFNGSLVQKMGYIEVPLEMSYKVLNRRFGVDLIGGVSTLFLNDNNVSVRSSQGYVSEVGEAENLNTIHFSTNIGVGFKYRFWRSFEANFEPMFKYQVNTFSNNSGNFKPYFIGLYSGISFSF